MRRPSTWEEGSAAGSTAAREPASPASSARGRPHPRQKRLPGLTAVPQVGQVAPTGAPHSSQNLLSAGISDSHTEQTTTPPGLAVILPDPGMVGGARRCSRFYQPDAGMVCAGGGRRERARSTAVGTGADGLRVVVGPGLF